MRPLLLILSGFSGFSTLLLSSVLFMSPVAPVFSQPANSTQPFWVLSFLIYWHQFYSEYANISDFYSEYLWLFLFFLSFLSRFIQSNSIKNGKVVVVLAGRYAGRKAVVVKANEEGGAKKFGHAEATSAIVVSYYWHFVDVVWIGLFLIVYVLK